MIATVRDVGRGGFGVVPGENGPVMIPRVLTGESIRYHITGHRHGVDWGEADEILSPSPYRVTPPCPHYDDCGGCNLQHATADHQIEIKSGILFANLKRIAGMKTPSNFRITASPPWGYRTRMALQIRNGQPGFFSSGSHRIVPIDSCPLMPGNMRECLRELIGHPRITTIEAGRMIMLSNGQEVSVDLAAGEEWIHLEGPEKISFTLSSGRFSVTPRNFIQANRFTMAAMHDFARPREADPATGLDLYAGAGFLTLPMARACKEGGWAVESEHHNLELLRRNLAENGLNRIRVLKRNISGKQLPRADFIIADPPRGGMPTRALDAIALTAPREFVLFSCDSATFSRDLARLIQRGFSPLEMELVDNFPQSDHMEIAIRLKGPRKRRLSGGGNRENN